MIELKRESLRQVSPVALRTMLNNLIMTLNNPGFCRSPFFILTIACATGFMGVSTVVCQDSFSPEEIEFFEQSVRPLLVDKCYECHGPDAEPLEGGLALNSRKAIIEGGGTGPAMVPGHPEESLLIDAINYGDVYEMPPDTKMDQDDIDTLTRWVEMGAPWPKEKTSKPTVKPEAGFDIKQRRSRHWCWQPIANPKVPAVSNQNWSQDAIDHFILAKLDSLNLRPAEKTSRERLIRRAYFDLLGLPPSPEEIKSFVAEKSETAYSDLLDRLLSSPQFGERWARHWMDLMRYAETCGHEFDYPIPFAHEYRDYLIRAFNADVPYDDFVKEHLAGDLLENPRRHATDSFNESILGTGFWFLGEAVHGPVDVKEDEARRIDNQIDVFSKSFLGLTVACARCHDHKFDAISAEDYYALSGFLQSSRRQLAMLDPGQKIRKAFQHASQNFEKADQQLPDYLGALGNADSERLSKHIHVALKKLKNDSSWNQPKPIRIQGEALQFAKPKSGVVENQKILARGDFRWEGDHQIWWRDGEEQDTWELEFQVPAVAGGQLFDLAINFTVAADYGVAALELDGKELAPNTPELLDFYSKKLATRLVEFGEQSLTPGSHKLTVRLASPNPAAIPRRMIGIDFLQLAPLSVVDEGTISQVEDKISEWNLSRELVDRWVAAIKSPRLNDAHHPLHFLQTLSRTSDFETLKIDDRNDEAFYDQTVLFESFDNGMPDNWHTTGPAFGKNTPLHSVSATRNVIAGPGGVNSGRLGRSYCGVLYSPTFEIEHDNILFRARGENVTVRLIIDGFVMDVYNALLFNGCRYVVKGGEQFRWHVMGGDIRNYKGHRAHLEFVDHGNGWVEIDEVRFGSRGGQRSTDAFRNRLIGNGLESAKQAANRLADMKEWAELPTSGIDPTYSYLSFLFEHNLVPEAETQRDRLAQLRSAATSDAGQAPRPRFGIAMVDGSPENEYIFVRGNHKTRGPVAPRRFLAAFDSDPGEFARRGGSGRLALAEKMVSEDNPLTSRVAVNRIWHHLFGRGLVKSVDNFGELGEEPTHPELLDYLANEFRRDGWSFKRMIKRLMMTQTYQMDSAKNPAAAEIDPENLYLHRASVRRLQGEAIRDSILKISGELNEQMFGPAVPIHLTSFMGGRGRPGKSGPLDGNGRRSIYIAIRRNFLSPMMLAFDTPIPFNSIGRRNQSNVPAQALIMMNDPMVVEQSRKWAEKLVTQEASMAERVGQVYFQAIGRKPTPFEMKQAHTFLRKQAAALGIDEDNVSGSVELWSDFCHVVFNTKEFIYIH